MHIPVHSPWLPGYIDVTQSILIILTVAGLFPDRPQRSMQQNREHRNKVMHYDKAAKNIQQETVASINGVGKIGQPHAKSKIGPRSYTIYKSQIEMD